MAEGSTGGAPAAPPNAKRWSPLFSQRNLAIAGAAVLLLVIVIFVARYRSGSERRRDDAILKATLDRLVTAQEGFYYDSTRYAGSLRALPTVTLPTGVHVQLFTTDKRSWWGVATHERMAARECVVWVGIAPAALPVEARVPEDETKPLCYDASRLPATSRSRGS